MTFAYYRLLMPFGRIIAADATATKGATIIDYEIERDHVTGRRQFVQAQLVEKCPTCTPLTGVSVEDVARDLEPGRCYVCGTPLDADTGGFAANH